MRELARRSDLAPTYVSNVLSGKQEPGAKFYIGVAKAFNLTLAQVKRLDQTGDIPSESAQIVSEISQLAQELPDEEKRLAYDFIKWRLQLSRERNPED